jgi:hypothetical protein
VSGKGRVERGAARCLAVVKAADGPLECSVEVVFDGIPHPLSRGGCRRETGAGVRCERSMRMERTRSEDGGSGRRSRIPLAIRGPFGGCGQPRPAASATNACRRCVRSGEIGKPVSPFSFVRQAAELLMTKVGGRGASGYYAKPCVAFGVLDEKVPHQSWGLQEETPVFFRYFKRYRGETTLPLVSPRRVAVVCALHSKGLHRT